jgi:hypothetical protein
MSIFIIRKYAKTHFFINICSHIIFSIRKFKTYRMVQKISMLQAKIPLDPPMQKFEQQGEPI